VFFFKSLKTFYAQVPTLRRQQKVKKIVNYYQIFSTPI